MARDDWLVGQDRAAAAAERLYDAATELIIRHGFDGFTIDTLAARVHCSPATVYRQAGGKAAIREAVTLRMSARVVDAVRQAIDGLTGAERIMTAVSVALQRIRAEPVAELMRTTIGTSGGQDWATSSPVVTSLAQEMLGSKAGDPVAAQWLIHVVLSLWCWPVSSHETEQDMLHRFVGPAFLPPGNQ